MSDLVLSKLAREAFGIEASAVVLPSERDWTARLDVDGVPRWVLKVHRDDPDLQDQVLRHLRPVRLADSAAVVIDGHERQVRLLNWIEGQVWADAGPPDAHRLRALGSAVAKLDRELATFDHDDLDRRYRWNMTQAADLLAVAADPFVVDTLTRFRDEVLPVLRTLPRQAIHNDANEHNVLVGARGEITGIIDVGDVVRAPRICGLAVALAYAQLGADDPVVATLPLLAAYHTEWPLSPEEVALLPDLVDTRLAMSVANAADQLRADPDNAYLGISQERVRRLIELLSVVPRELREARYRDACGYRPVAREREVVRWLQTAFAAPVVGCEPPVRILDWSLPGPPDLDVGAGVAIGRYGEDRGVYLSDAFRSTDGRRRSVHLGIDVFVAAGEPAFAPFDGVVHSSAHRPEPYDFGGVVLLEHRTDGGVPFWSLIGHLEPEVPPAGRRVRRGERIGTVGTPAVNGQWPPHVHVQLFTTLLGRGTDLPGVIEPDDLDVWQSICPDPNLMLRLPVTSAPRAHTAADIQRLRQAHLSPALSTSYTEPLHIVSGQGAHLVDARGRSYLDLVNNVCHVGHCHPRVVEALAEQARTLNTNTRYLHANITEYARRLAATFPDPLSVVMLTNSGSEANDLALRLARVATGRDRVLALDWAYHGNLSSLIEISPYKFNRHGGPGPRVHVCSLPDPYRGRFGADGPRYADDLLGVEAAAFIHESMPGCAGQIELAPGYLPAAYEIARQQGALCIADEVQCGFGRVGSDMWAFERHGVVPDIVTLGKPIGNGHPIGAVVTTPKVARAFNIGMEYFNTFGGNPVSCAVALAVLDVVQDERLMTHAATVGDILMQGISGPLVGDIRGRGLFIGVDLVEDHTTKAPATAAARRVVEAAKRQGILLSTDGPADNVLKIKPPLVLTPSDAHHTVHVINEALRDAT